MASYHPCGCGCGSMIKQNEVHWKAYVNNAHRQKAYRRRRHLETSVTPIERIRLCLNCGKQFSSISKAHKYCSVSCRSSYWQKMKRRAAEENQNV